MSSGKDRRNSVIYEVQTPFCCSLEKWRPYWQANPIIFFSQLVCAIYRETEQQALGQRLYTNMYHLSHRWVNCCAAQGENHLIRQLMYS